MKNFFKRSLNSKSFNKFFFIQQKNYENFISRSNKNSVTYFDISIDGKLEGRIILDIFSKFVPKTSLNFLNLCNGVVIDGKNYSYKNSKFHKIVPGMIVQGGEVSKNNEISSFGKRFPDENYIYSHDKPGILSMVNDGPNSNGSQFFITTSDCTW